METGQTLGIYSIFCIITIFGVKDFPKYLVIKRGDKRSPVFDILGQLTREGRKRLLNLIDSEIRFKKILRYCPFLSFLDIILYPVINTAFPILQKIIP